MLQSKDINKISELKNGFTPRWLEPDFIFSSLKCFSFSSFCHCISPVKLMEEGLKLYREAALTGPESKRQQAIREVVVAEQVQRMMQSDYAILEFEDLRLQLVKEQDSQKAGAILDQMESIVSDEIARTELSLLAATRDSRLGFQCEQDYVYTPYSLREKLGVLKETLNAQLPTARRRKSISK